MSLMYFIAHVLPEEINEDVLAFKQKMFDRFGCTTALKSPAHITLVPPFWMDNILEDELKSGLDGLAVSIESFFIRAENFSAFKPKTIFIEPILSKQLSALKLAADTFITGHAEFGAKTDERRFHPHITIATRDLHKKNFAEAWEMFQNKTFAAEWEAKSLSLLRHNKKNWDVIHTSQFKNV
jgi:2'-5' RNA ligase